MRKRKPGVSHQKVEQLELLGRQVNGPSGSLHQPARRVKFYFTDTDDGGKIHLGRMHAAHGSAQPRRQFPTWKGLVMKSSAPASSA